MNINSINKLVKEEFASIIAEAKKKSPKIEQELLKLREKFFPEILAKEGLGATHPRGEKRVALDTVCTLLDMPKHEVMLHFLNKVKGDNERQLVEMRLGHVYFYAF
jgi:hypothetical protein